MKNSSLCGNWVEKCDYLITKRLKWVGCDIINFDLDYSNKDALIKVFSSPLDNTCRCEIWIGGIKQTEYYDVKFRLLIMYQIDPDKNGIYEFYSCGNIKKISVLDDSFVFVNTCVYFKNVEGWRYGFTPSPPDSPDSPDENIKNNFPYQKVKQDKIKNLIGVDTEIFFEQLDEIEEATTTATVFELRSLVADLAGVTRSILMMMMENKKN